jgi:nitroreductase
MNEALKNIYGRASVRKYKEEKVPDDVIREILKAGFHAANGLNRQAVRFVVVENRQLINKYNKQAIKLFAEMMRSFGQPDPVVEKMVEDPKSDIFYGAPALLFVYTDPTAVSPAEDGLLAAGNMMLAAHSMGYGTCFIGFAIGLGNDPEFRNECNVPEGYGYHACLILGKPEGDIENRPRSEVKILKWVK